MENIEVARMLENIADILEILEESPFKIRAYRQAARTISHLGGPVNAYWQEGRLQQIPGVGKAIEAKIDEILKTGELHYYHELLRQVPEGVLNMLGIPGVGPKTIRVIQEHLAIDNLDDLLQAAKDRRIRQLPGLGAKTEYNIKKGIEMLRTTSDCFTLGMSLPVARRFCSFMALGEGIEKAELVGSIRRRKPVVHDIDMVVGATSEQAVRDRVSGFLGIKEMNVEESGIIRGIISPGIKFEVITVKPQDFFLALLLATGNQEHRQQLVKLIKGICVAPGMNEEGIYKALGLQWIPPELRENRGELARAREGSLPLLINCGDLQGDLHVHTRWSDGAHVIEDMVKEAQAMGYAYLAITEHSKSLTVSRGLDERRLREQIDYIAQLNEKLKGFRVLTGIEVDILKDGSLDLPDEILRELDVVVASIHSYFNLSRQDQTRRQIAAIRNENVDIIGHLTGRLLNRRPGYEVEVDAVLREAQRYGTALEINSHPDRLDISEEVAMLARQMEVKVAISSDAHHVGDLALVEYGIYNARRGWLEPKDVLNTLSVQELLDYFHNRRQ